MVQGRLSETNKRKGFEHDCRFYVSNTTTLLFEFKGFPLSFFFFCVFEGFVTAKNTVVERDLSEVTNCITLSSRRKLLEIIETVHPSTRGMKKYNREGELHRCDYTSRPVEMPTPQPRGTRANNGSSYWTGRESGGKECGRTMGSCRLFSENGTGD